MWKKLTLMVALLGLAMLLVLPLNADKPTPTHNHGGDGEPVPGGTGLIAFNDVGVITLMNPDGSGRTPVALAGSSGRKPAWSPMFFDDSVKLAYPQQLDRPDTFNESLMVVDVFPDVGEPVAVFTVQDTPSSGGLYQVDWSPSEVLEDGTERVRVSFATFVDFDIPDLRREVIHIVDLTYHLSTTESPGFFTVDPVPPLVLDPGPGSSYFRARFSPDGNWLALQRIERLADGTSNKSIWLAESDGTNVELLIDGAGEVDRGPAWSPNGTMLAFASDRDHSGPGLRLDIYVFDFLDESIDRLTSTTKVSESSPSWSPDGSQIVFEGRRRSRELVKIVVTGEVFGLGSGDYPDWSPMDLPLLP